MWINNSSIIRTKHENKLNIMLYILNIVLNYMELLGNNPFRI